jgi:hypothetical protein
MCYYFHYTNHYTNLETESYKFLEECLKYSMLPVADVSAHYAAFQAIIAAFVAVNSRFEINISTALRNKVYIVEFRIHTRCILLCEMCRCVGISAYTFVC